MPEFLPADSVSFVIEGEMPLLRLAVAGPGSSTSDGWSVHSMMSMCVVDGPGDQGYLIARFGPQGADIAPDGWDAAVQRAGGAVVSFGIEAETQRFFVPSLA